jgi:phosphoglycolate phosphatase
MARDRAFDSIVFDLDGTLWDATAASAEGWTRGARTYGQRREITAIEIAGVCGLPFATCARTLFPDLSREELDALLPDLEQHEQRAVRERGGLLYPGVRAYLPRLAKCSPLFLLSNCQRWYMDAFLDQSGLRGVFRGTLCHGDTGLSKAENLAVLQKRHDLREPVYVGDTVSDREAARIAGCTFLHAAWGFGSVEGAPAFLTFRDLATWLNPGA